MADDRIKKPQLEVSSARYASPTAINQGRGGAAGEERYRVFLIESTCEKTERSPSEQTRFVLDPKAEKVLEARLRQFITFDITRHAS